MSDTRLATAELQVQDIVDDFLNRCAAGEAVSEVSLADDYPHLQPALGVALRRARLVANARERAKEPSPGSPHSLAVCCPHCRQKSETPSDASLDALTCSHCGQSFSLTGDHAGDGDFAAGQVIGHFELLAKLGEGGFGTVWTARDTQLDRLVAVKMPRRDLLSSREAELFFREARAAAQLRHPNIAAIHEVGRDGDTVYIVGELVHGVSLADWARGPLAPRAAASLCETIAKALHHAHRAGVIHRDLKPSNVLIDAAGQPHLVDFGLAKRDTPAGASGLVTADGQMIGTPAYMSPEQARGTAHDCTAASDVYSLGVLMYQLLTGEVPFRGNAAMVLAQIIADEPPSPRQFVGNLPRDLETISLKCLEKDPLRRYRTAEALADDLARFSRGEPILARPISSLQRAWRWCRRYPVAAALVALLLSIAVVGPLVAVRQSLLAEQEVAARRRGDHALYVAHMNLAQAACDNHDLATAEHYLGLHADDELRTFEWFHWRHVCHEGHVATLPADRVCATVALSPDGRTLAYERTKNQISLYDLKENRVRDVLSGHTARILDLKFSPSGDRLASCGFDERVIVWDLQALSPVRTLIPQGRGGVGGNESGAIAGVAFSPDAAFVAAACVDGYTRCWNLADGKLAWEYAAPNSPKATNNLPLQLAQAVAFSPDGSLIATAGGTHLPAHGHIIVRRVEDGTEVFKRDDVSHQVHRIAFSADGMRLATYGSRGAPTVYGVSDWRTIPYQPQPSATHVVAVAWSPDPAAAAQLAAAGHDGQIHVWDAAGNLVRTFPGHRQMVTDVAFAPDGQILASAGYDNSVRVWDLSAPRAIERIAAHDHPAALVELSADGQTCLSSDLPGNLKLVEVPRADIRVPGVESASPQRSSWQELYSNKHNLPAALSPDGQRIAARSDDERSVQIIDPRSQDATVGISSFQNRPPQDLVFDLAWSPGGDVLAVAGGKNVPALRENPADIELWNIRGRSLAARLVGHDRFVEKVAFSGDGRLIASAGGDRRVILWDAKSRAMLHAHDLIQDGSNYSIAAVALSPDGKILAAGNRGGRLWLWSTEPPFERLVTRDSRNSMIYDLDFAPDGKTLAVAIGQSGAESTSPAGTNPAATSAVKLFDLTTHEFKTTLAVPTTAVRSIRFAPDGQSLIAACEDGKIQIWRAPNSQP